MKQKLDDYGFSYLMNSDNTSSLCFKTIQRRIRDTFIQEWLSSINNCLRLEYNCKFNNCFEFENYLMNLKK